MTELFLGIGHGIMPDGRFDPGAVHNGLVEHHLARLVVEACSAALERSGFHDFYAEQSTDAHPSDPDYRGSVIKANAIGARWCCEVHFNAGGGGSGHGTETLFYPGSVNGRHLATAVQTRLDAAVGIANRGVKERPDLWFLRGCAGAAIIPEVAFVDGDNATIKDHPALCRNAGEALAHGLLQAMGRRYVPLDAYPFKISTIPAGKGGTAHNVPDALAVVRHALATGARTVTVHHGAG